MKTSSNNTTQTAISLLVSEFDKNGVSHKVESHDIQLNDGTILTTKSMVAEKNGVCISFSLNKDGSLPRQVNKVNVNGRGSMIRPESIMKHLK